MGSEPQPPFFGMDWDDELEKSPEIARIIYRSHLHLERWLKVHAKRRSLDLELLQGFHRQLFKDVFPDFAGHLRGPSPKYIARNITFGRYRGTEFEEVPERCSELMVRLGGYIKDLDGQQERGESTFETDVVKVASYAHCELVRIHPFANGNGRVAREVINYFAWRYGFSPIPIGRPEQKDYLGAIRTWIRDGSIGEFMEFLDPLMRERVDA